MILLRHRHIDALCSRMADDVADDFAMRRDDAAIDVVVEQFRAVVDRGERPVQIDAGGGEALCRSMRRAIAVKDSSMSGSSLRSPGSSAMRLSGASAEPIAISRDGTGTIRAGPSESTATTRTVPGSACGVSVMSSQGWFSTSQNTRAQAPRRNSAAVCMMRFGSQCVMAWRSISPRDEGYADPVQTGILANCPDLSNGFRCWLS